MSDKKVQRIKLRIEGSPVKWDATVTSFADGGKTITVEFDGPLPPTTLHAAGGNKMVSAMKDKDGKSVDDFRQSVNCQWWEVL